MRCYFQLCFACSNAGAWCVTDVDFSYDEFYTAIVDYFEVTPGPMAQARIDDLLAWWNRLVYSLVALTQHWTDYHLPQQSIWPHYWHTQYPSSPQWQFCFEACCAAQGTRSRVVCSRHLELHVLVLVPNDIFNIFVSYSSCHFEFSELAPDFRQLPFLERQAKIFRLLNRAHGFCTLSVSQYSVYFCHRHLIGTFAARQPNM